MNIVFSRPIISDIQPKNGRVISQACDVSDAAAVTELFARCRRELGPIDWLVNNAAIARRTPLGQITEQQWDEVLGINLKGPMLCAQAALPDLIDRKGRIVNVSSISGTLGTPQQSAYNASKWGLNGLTMCWADELKAQGLKVEERAFTVEEAYEAREAFVTSASQIVMPVVSIDGRSVGNGAPGLLTSALRREYHQHAEIA